MSGYRCTGRRYHPDGDCTQDPDACRHFCCKMRYLQGRNGSGGSLRLSSTIVPHVKERDARHEPRASDNSWEKGLVGEHRVDGSFMPLLDSAGDPVTNGEAKRHGGSSWVDRTMREIRRPADSAA